MRLLAPLALAVALLSPVPAAAGPSSPPAPSAGPTSPAQPHATPRTDGPCPVFRVDGPRTVAVGTTAHYVAQPTGGRIPYRWTVVRTAPGPEEVVSWGTSESGWSFALTVTATSSYRVEATAYDGCEAPGHGVTAFTVEASDACPTTTAPGWQVVDANAAVALPVEVRADTATVRLRRTSPAPSLVVREGAGDQAWTVRVPESTVLSLEGEHGCPARDLRLLVRPVLTLHATRTAARDYVFSGRVTPGRGQALTLHRVEPDGRRVLTARTTVAPDGTYRVSRRFTGSGRFGFVVVLAPGSAGRTLPGESPVRPTVVH